MPDKKMTDEKLFPTTELRLKYEMDWALDALEGAERLLEEHGDEAVLIIFGSHAEKSYFAPKLDLPCIVSSALSCDEWIVQGWWNHVRSFEDA